MCSLKQSTRVKRKKGVKVERRRKLQTQSNENISVFHLDFSSINKRNCSVCLTERASFLLETCLLPYIV